jgi:hypothetical protein
MKLVHLAPGYAGARQIAAARAESALRKLGHVPQIKYRSNGRDRGWTDEEYDEAIVMRLNGLTDDQIAAKTGRSKFGVTRQIGAKP